MHLRRIGNRFTVGLLLALLLAGLFAHPSRAAAPRDNGLTSDTSYESPEFNYEIEWDDPWIADESETESSRDSDSLTLTSEGAFLSILGFEYEGDPAEAVAVIIGSLEGNTDDFEIVDESGDDDVASAEVVFDLDGTAVSEYIEARPIGRGASIVVTLTSPSIFYDDELGSAGELIELDGDSLFTGLDTGGSSRDDDDDTRARGEDDDDDSRTRDRDDEDEDEDEDTSGRDRELAVDEDEDEEGDDRQSRNASGVDGSAYISPTYGYSLEWTRDWEFIEDSEMVGDGRSDVDEIGVFNGTSAVYVSGRVDYDGDAASCVEGEADSLATTDGIEDVELLTGDDGEPLGVAGDEFAFGLYSLISSGGDGPIIQIVYIECRTVVADEAVVSMVGAMPLDEFESEFESVLALSDALVVDAR